MSRPTCLFAAVAGLLLLGACAPDAWKPNPNYNAFLNQVDRVCGMTRMGELSVRDLLGASQSAYFMDQTTRLDAGKISDQAYVDSMVLTFDVSPNSPAIKCILAQKK